MKKFFGVILTLVMCLPFVVNAADKKEKVKVYVFEAGGCPYCEQQLAYLKGLKDYNKTFEIVEKELYIDHEKWEPGADYNLGVNVANAFVNAGYDEDEVNAYGTPLVVISDIYAMTAYSTSLESVIAKAYEEGDKDAVTCVANGGTDCVRSIIEKPKDYTVLILLCTIISTVVTVGTYVIKSNCDKKAILKAINPKEVEKEEKTPSKKKKK